MVIARRTPLRRTPIRNTRTKPRRKVKARGKASYGREADKLARAIVLTKAGVKFDAKGKIIPGTGECQVCAEPSRDGDPIQWCHIFTRRRYVLRWAEDGAIAAHASEHRKFTSDPEAWRAYLVGRMGEDGYYALYRASQGTMGGSISVTFYQDLIAALKDRLDEVASRG